MSMWEDVLKSIQLNLSDRLASPLLGSFSISWCIINYRAVLILLSEEPVRKSFDMLHELAYPTQLDFWLKAIIYPLITSLTYVFAYPYPAKYVFQFTQKKRRELLELKRKIDEQTPMTPEEWAREKESVFRSFEVRDREIARLKLEIESLNIQLAAKGSTISSAPEVHNIREQHEITKSQLRLLRAIQSLPGIFTSRILREMPDLLEAEFDHGELVRKSLIDVVDTYPSGVREQISSLTHEGRRVLLKYKDTA